MRIGIDTTPLPRQPLGAGTYVIELVRALSALKSKHRFVLVATETGRTQIGELDAESVEWIITPNYPPALRLIWEQVKLPGIIRRSGVDLLHSLHYTQPYRLSCSSVVTFHDMTFFLFPELHTPIKRLLFPYAMRLSSRRADALLASSESTRQDILQILGIPEERVHTAPLGISKKFHPIKDPQLLEDCRQKYRLPAQFILFVGLFEPRKNLPLLLRAYRRILKEYDVPPLVLVGRKGWNTQQVIREIQQVGLDRKIFWLDYLPSQDLPIVYNLAQVFVYPTLYEGFGFPPMEAMACGTPVITSDVSALAENIGEAGLLIHPQDEQALANALHRLTSDPDLRQKLAQAGIQRALTYTWDRTARQTMHVYEQLS